MHQRLPTVLISTPLGIILTTKNINPIRVTIQRYPMGEIKSTLDLVMEKTRHLTLSQEEKEEQKHIEVNKRLKGLLQKYQDNLLKKEHLEKELDSLRKAYDLKVDKMLSRMLLDSLKLGHKNESLLELLNEICGLDISGLETLFHDFQDAVGFASEKRIKEVKADLAEKRFISGSAVVPNLETDNELILTVKEIKDKFDQILVREKTPLYDRIS
jgi:hypothetical protein